MFFVYTLESGKRKTHMEPEYMDQTRLENDVLNTKKGVVNSGSMWVSEPR